MITVKSKKINTKTSDFVRSGMIMAINLALDELAKQFRKISKDQICSDHPDHNCVITLVGDEKKHIVVNKSNFCCKAFEDSIEVK